MLESIFTFILNYKWIILFYLLVIIFLIIKRKRLDYQAKIIVLYRTKFGLKFMDKFVKKYGSLTVLLGYIGVGVGFVGLIFIAYILIKNLIDLIIKPTAVSGVSLVLPGINVPGLGVLPFWYWILAIFLIALVHEFAHGIVARAHKLEIKNTGFVLFGPIIGAFVEPNEEKIRKAKDIDQYSVLAAGSFANIILALVALVLLTFVLMPVQQALVEPAGFSFGNYYGESFPAANVGLPINSVITGINGEKTKDFYEFDEKLFCLDPGENISLTSNGKDYSLLLANNPDKEGGAFLGISNIKNEFEIKEKYDQGLWKVLYYFINWLSGFFKWLFILSLGIGLFNLLPLPIVDGGRMLQVYLHNLKGKKKGEKYYHKITLFFLLVLLLNFFYPLLKGWFGF